MDLFRTEALTARREDFLGAIDLTRARMAWPMALLAAAFILGLAAFAALGEHTRSERADGRLVLRDSLNPVLAPESGVVMHVLVHEGETVRRGQGVVRVADEQHRARVLRAAADGVVASVAVAAGQSVPVGQRLLNLVPHDAYLHAEFWLSSDAVAQLAPGMRVTMRYRSFPFRQFGHQYGRVLSIADTALAPEEVAAMSGARPSGAAFRVLVQLDRQSVASTGAELPLRSGMQVEAEFMLERRRLYQLAIGVREPVAGRQ